ncbi:DUF4976 domain-containing protein [Clostridiales bacterium COT073_COT-073]|nr:DUF4976 domain-containing protein [Clostridiales bacterium COT073_COT-073]
MTKERLNLLFVMTDHQRFDSLFMEQCGRQVTPYLNRLAEESCYFTRAYNTCPLCVPARTALATGVYPTQNQVVFNDWQGQTAQPIEPIQVTLQRAGYRVGHVGVNHIQVIPNLRDQGLDLFIDQNDYQQWAEAQGIDSQRREADLIEVKEEVRGEYQAKKYSSSRSSRWPYPPETHKDFYFLQRALEFLRQEDERPFALFVYFWAPHPPLIVPPPYDSMYPPKDLILPANINQLSVDEPTLRRLGVPAQLAEKTDPTKWRQVWSAHLGLVTMADEWIGHLLETLKTQERYDDTIVVFTPDHGDHLGQHRMYQKMEMYEQAIRVPMLIRHPAGRRQTIETVVSHLDVVPTLYDLMAVGSLQKGQIGRSLRPEILGQKAPKEGRAFCQYSGNPDYGTIRRAIITQRYKFIYDSNHQGECYDLQTDSLEMKNIAGLPQYQALVGQLYQECRQFHREQADFFKWDESVGQNR